MKTYQLDQRNYSLEILSYWQREGWLELNAPYQRGSVWGPRRRANLIKSILLGIPIPSVVINERTDPYFHHDESCYAIIDGKQRIESILLFMSDGVQVPRNWFPDNHINEYCKSDLITFRDLTKVGGRVFRNNPIICSVGRIKSIDVEREIFDLINFGGLKQGEIDDDCDAPATAVAPSTEKVDK